MKYENENEKKRRRKEKQMKERRIINFTTKTPQNNEKKKKERGRDDGLNRISPKDLISPLFLRSTPLDRRSTRYSYSMALRPPTAWSRGARRCRKWAGRRRCRP